MEVASRLVTRAESTVTGITSSSAEDLEEVVQNITRVYM